MGFLTLENKTVLVLGVAHQSRGADGGGRVAGVAVARAGRRAGGWRAGGPHGAERSPGWGRRGTFTPATTPIPACWAPARRR